MNIVNLKIPYEYQEVEYIEAPAAGYIDTLYIPDYANGFRITIDFSVSTLGKRYGLLSNYNVGTSQLSLELNASNKARLWLNNGNVDTNNTNIINTSTLPAFHVGRNVVTFAYENKVCYIGCNGIEVSGNYTTTINPATSTMYLFLDRAKRSGTFTEPLKIYSCIIQTKGQCVMDLIPCYKKSDNTFGMFDIATQRFLPVEGTGTFNKGNNNNHIIKYKIPIGTKVPIGYQELDYIECDGNQYINLGKIFTSVDIDLYMETDPSFTNQERCLVGAGGYLEFGWSSSANRVMGWSSGLGSVAFTDPSVYERNIIQYSQTNLGRTIKINNLQASDNSFASITNINICLFAYEASNMNYNFKGKFYNGIIKQQNKIIKTLIPCKRISDNKIGLYDSINDIFHISSSSTDFIAGNAKNILLKCSPKA